MVPTNSAVLWEGLAFTPRNLFRDVNFWRREECPLLSRHHSTDCANAAKRKVGQAPISPAEQAKRLSDQADRRSFSDKLQSSSDYKKQ